MWQRLISGWNFMRLIRLALGLVIMVQGVQNHDYAVAGLGILFALMPLFNIGCCAGSACYTSPSSKALKTEKSGEIEYEQIIAK
jgi:hypothetical protein